jgi:hypothetical protein
VMDASLGEFRKMTKPSRLWIEPLIKACKKKFRVISVPIDTQKVG